MIIKVVILLLLATESSMSSQVICGLHQVAEFNCQFKPIGDYSIMWTVNNISLNNIIKERSQITTTFEHRMLHLNCTETFLNSVVQCERHNLFNVSDPTVLYGEVFFVQIQGLLDEVKEVNVSIICSFITLTWQPPFSLDITNTDPDMTFCVEVYNVSEGEKTPLHHLGQCSIVAPQYILSTNSVLGSVLEYQFIITAVNVVGQGAPSDPIDVMFHDDHFIGLYDPDVHLSDSGVMTAISAEIIQSSTSCFKELTVHIEYEDDTHCSSPAHLTDALNRIEYLILNDEDPTMGSGNCPNISYIFVNYVLHVETKYENISSNFTVVYLPTPTTFPPPTTLPPPTIMTMNTYTSEMVGTSSTEYTNSLGVVGIAVPVGIAVVMSIVIVVLAFILYYYSHHRKEMKKANLCSNPTLSEPTYYSLVGPTSSPDIAYSIIEHHSQDFPTGIDATYSLLKPVHPPLDSDGKPLEESMLTLKRNSTCCSPDSSVEEQIIKVHSNEDLSTPVDDPESTSTADNEVANVRFSSALLPNKKPMPDEREVKYAQLDTSDPNSSAGVIIVNDVIYSDIVPFTGISIPKEKEEMKAQPKPAVKPPMTAEDLFHDLYSIAGKWSEFALKIGIDEDLEDEIYTNNESNEACLQETLEYFFKRRAPFKEIPAALCHIEEHELACTLSKKYSQVSELV